MTTRKPANQLPETLAVIPLQARVEEKRNGRPRKPVRPPLPAFPMTELEQQWYDYFIACYTEEYKDLTNSDHTILMMAGVEFIKYLRIQAWELENNQTISMARQHPGVQMRALLDQLSVTRKARKADKNPADDALKEAREMLLGLSAS